jgi:predicted alpha-1,6-mannanase (GH76 family)
VPGVGAATQQAEPARSRRRLAAARHGRPRGERREDRDAHWRDWIESWRQLVDARITYADALDREAGGGEPAFFVAPQGRHGTPVVERLTDDSPDSCGGAIRRLAGPDL